MPVQVGRGRRRPAGTSDDVDILDAVSSASSSTASDSSASDSTASDSSASDSSTTPRRPGNRWWAVGLVAAALVVVAAAVHFGPDDNSAAAIRSAAPTQSAGAPQFRAPAYATDVRFGRTGRYLVTGTPPTVNRSLHTVFGSVSGVRVQTVFVRASTRAHRLVLTSRTIVASSGRFRIGVVIGKASNVASAALPVQAAGAGQARSFGQYRAGGLAIQVYVAGPNTMSLTLLNGNQQVLAGLIGG